MTSAVTVLQALESLLHCIGLFDEVVVKDFVEPAMEAVINLLRGQNVKLPMDGEV